MKNEFNKAKVMDPKQKVIFSSMLLDTGFAMTDTMSHLEKKYACNKAKGVLKSSEFFVKLVHRYMRAKTSNRDKLCYAFSSIQ